MGQQGPGLPRAQPGHGGAVVPGGRLGALPMAGTHLRERVWRELPPHPGAGMGGEELV